MKILFDKIIKSFRKKEKKSIEKEKFEQKEYNPKGNEPICMACENYILDYERSSRLLGKKIHSKCLRRLKKIAMNDQSFINF